MTEIWQRLDSDWAANRDRAQVSGGNVPCKESGNGWWDRKGENEIDLVGENEFDNILHFYEVKRNQGRIDLTALARKAEAFLAKHPEMRSRMTGFKGLSLPELLDSL